MTTGVSGLRRTVHGSRPPERTSGAASHRTFALLPVRMIEFVSCVIVPRVNLRVPRGL